jgi:hypothetical protein
VTLPRADTASFPSSMKGSVIKNQTLGTHLNATCGFQNGRRLPQDLGFMLESIVLWTGVTGCLVSVVRTEWLDRTVFHRKVLDSFMTSEVLTVVNISVLTFGVVRQCTVVGTYQRFGGNYCLHLQVWSALKMEAVCWHLPTRPHIVTTRKANTETFQILVKFRFSWRLVCRLLSCVLWEEFTDVSGVPSALMASLSMSVIVYGC